MQKYELIINPASRSGNGMRIWKEEIKPVLEANKIPFNAHFSHKASDVAVLSSSITGDYAKENLPLRLIILGGDGTFNEALQGISFYDNMKIGYIPTGSSNDLARDLGIPKNPQQALNLILDEKHVCYMDLGCVRTPDRTTYFAVSCGIGFDAAVCEEAMNSKIKDFFNRIKLGKLTYFGIAIKQLISAKKTACDLFLDNDNEPIHINRLLFTVSMIHRFEGGGFKFCPTADCTDGRFELCVAGDVPKPVILLALPTAFFGKHYMVPGIHAFHAEKITIKTNKPLWVHTDGEVHEMADFLEISCRQKTIPMIV